MPRQKLKAQRSSIRRGISLLSEAAAPFLGFIDLPFDRALDCLCSYLSLGRRARPMRLVITAEARSGGPALWRFDETEAEEGNNKREKTS